MEPTQQPRLLVGAVMVLFVTSWAEIKANRILSNFAFERPDDLGIQREMPVAEICGDDRHKMAPFDRQYFRANGLKPQDGRGRPFYALVTRESFVAERRGNVWRRRYTFVGRPMVWRWFHRRFATRWFGGAADRGLKPTATFDDRSATKHMNQ